MAVKRGLGKGLDSMIPKRKKPDTASDQQKQDENQIKEANQAADISPDKDLPSERQEKTRKISENKSGHEFENTRARDEQPGNLENKNAEGPERIVKISKVEPNRNQPRKRFNEDALAELSESIRQYGILQPLLVSDQGSYYEIIAGERRWRAAKMAGLKEIPVIIKEYNNQQIVEISLIENIQREDLNAIEEAKAYKNLIDEFGLTQDELADRLSKSRTAVTNSMRLLKLGEDVQQMLIDEMISAGHARALLGLTDQELQKQIALKVFDEKLSVRETEKLVKKMTSVKVEKPVKVDQKQKETENVIYENLEEKIKQILGTKVQIQRKRNHKGKIEIEYYSREELERIIDLLQSIQL